MSARIDLEAYAGEVKAFSALAEKFVPHSSVPALRRLEQDLRAGISRANSSWTWSTIQEVVFKPSGKYDAPGKPKPAHFSLGFECVFTRPAGVNQKKCGPVWEISHGSTHVKVEREDKPSLELHFDYKNIGQLGPQLHVQVAESQTGGLPIPRLVAMAFLPTDCADIMLCELHPTDWERHQRAGGNQWNVTAVRNGQEKRTMAYLNDIHTQWKSDVKQTRFSALQSYTAKVAMLPAHDSSTKRGW